MRTLRKTLELLTPHEKRRGVFVLLMVVGMAVLEAVGVASVMPFLAVLGNPEMVESNAHLARIYHYVGATSVDGFLIVLGTGAFTLILLSATYRTVTLYAMNRFIEMRRHSIGARLLETYLRQPYAFFLERHSGDMSKVILSEVDQLVQNVFRPSIMMIAHGVVLFGLIILLFIANPLLAVVVATVFGGLYTFIYAIVRGYLGRIGKVRTISNNERFVSAGEAFGGIKDIKLLGREHAYLTRFISPSRQFASTQASIQTLSQVPNYLVEAVAFGGILLLTIVLLAKSNGSHIGVLGEILPILGLYAFAAYRMKPAAQNIYRGVAQLRFGAGAVDVICEDLRKRTTLAEIVRDNPEPLNVKQEVKLERLSYTYPNASRPTLHDIELRIPAGTSIGLVGSTGAGKTTLVDVLLGLLRPTQGAIIVDGIAVTDATLRAWQQSLGYVPQDIFLTDTSVAENIALGIPTEKIDLEHVTRCARMAQVHDFVIRELPQQYATVVGERGVRLSGGQRQRIGIARALYHNPDVLVFDEATSALDTLMEHAVMEAINVLANQKTIILIAHRLSTVRSCDKIVVLDKGRIVAEGTYDDLSSRNEHFQNLANVGSMNTK